MFYYADDLTENIDFKLLLRNMFLVNVDNSVHFKIDEQFLLKARLKI